MIKYLLIIIIILNILGIACFILKEIDKQRYETNNDTDIILKYFKVKHFPNKIRLGALQDGGYVIGTKDNIKYDCYLNCGVSNEDSFSRDFIKYFKMNKKDCYAFDGTIEDYPWEYTTNINFIKKNIMNFNDDNNTDLSEYIDKYNNIFLNIDIEGWEIPWILHTTKERMKKFSQIVIEFHGINNNSWEQTLSDKIKCYKKLLETHYVIHAHFNNHGKELYNSNHKKITDVIELTYLNKKFFNKIPIDNYVKLPIDKLDYPNDPNNNVIDLNFEPFTNIPKD